MEGIAGTADCRRAGQNEVFHIGAKRITFRAVHRVDLRGVGVVFHHRVAGAENVGIAAVATGKHIRRVVRGAIQGVRQHIAGAADGGATGQDQILQAVCQRIGQRDLRA